MDEPLGLINKIVRKMDKILATLQKHQSPSTCLRRSGFAQAGQIPNNIQIPISNDRDGFVSKFGHLVIGNYLGFGCWDFPTKAGFGSGNAGSPSPNPRSPAKNNLQLRTCKIDQNFVKESDAIQSLFPKKQTF
jgi:hypothetical protein